MHSSQTRQADREVLRSGYLLRGADPCLAERTLKDERIECLSYEGGEFIHQPGQRRHFAGVLLGGKARLRFFEGERAVNMLGPGEFFGVTSLYTPSGVFPASVRANGRCRALFLPKELVSDLLREDETVLHNHLAFLSERIQGLNHRLQGVFADTTAQLAAYLSDQQRREGEAFVLPYGMTTLAAALGFSRASLYRAMDELSGEGLIRRDGRQIHVLNATALREYSKEKTEKKE